MESHRTIDLRAAGIRLSFAVALLAGCANSEPVGPGGEGTAGSGGSGANATSPASAGASPVAPEHRIKAFVFDAADNDGLAADATGVVGDDGAIEVSLPAASDVSSLIPTIDIVGKAVAPGSGVAQDFSQPVAYLVTAEDGTAATFTVTVTVDAPTCVGSATSCSTDVYERAVQFANDNPTRPVSHGTWNQYCAALMYWFGGFSVSAPSAAAAYAASNIVSLDPTTAPIGAFHYWSIPGITSGHVGVDLLGQGAVVFMATSHVADHWGTSGYVGVNNVASYTEATGATYLGWSMEYNGHNQKIAGGGACGAATVPAGCSIPLSTTVDSGAPDGAFVMRLQRYGQDHGYTGAIDGSPNAATWKAVQSGLASYGYSGPQNGLPGTNTYKAFQTLAQDEGGYTGPINGVLGPNSFRGFAAFLNSAY